jgi:mannose-6-phosphate isomerase-like protein (cupin superfamily)
MNATHVRWDDIPDSTKVPRPEGYVHPWPMDRPYTTRVYDEAIGVQHLSFVINRMPPETSGQHHRHVEAEEVHTVLKGRCRMRIGDEEVDLERYDSVRVPAHEFRSMFNPGPEECWMLVMGGPLDEFLPENLDAFFAANDWTKSEA